MPRIKPVAPEEATGKTKELYEGLQKKMGKVINIFQIMGHSPSVLNAYLQFSGALAESSLDARLREQIALATAQTNRCDYCLSAHSTIGKTVGLSEQDLLNARQYRSEEARTQAALEFTRRVVESRAQVSDADVEGLRAAGFNDQEVVEIIGIIALNMFTNYFNHIAGTEVDFPRAANLAGA
jgi:uncharacterized peroxidase-related enzyme